jgi:cytochrome c peroxidase
VVLGAVALLLACALVVLALGEGPATSAQPEATPAPDRMAWKAAATLAGEPERPVLAAAVQAPRPTAKPEARPAAPTPTRVAVVSAGRDDPLVELGRRLFFDPAASHSKNASCASCHRPEHGFSDPAARSADDFGTTPRHSQTVLNVALNTSLHWDGEFSTLEELVLSRTGDTRATDGGYTAGRGATRKVTPVAESLAKEGLYESAFIAAFGRGTPTRQQTAEAVAAYVRTLSSTTSPFDRFLDGESNALSAEAVRGFHLFRGRAGCAQCHALDGGSRPTFTDQQFHNTGIAQGRRHDGRAEIQKAEGRFAEGRRRVSERPSDTRAMKTPSLRDVATRAPYMHDGSFATLAQVVRYYAVECGTTGDPHLDPKLVPFDAGRSATEVDLDVADLVAFLNSLTGERRAGLAESAWNQRAVSMRLKFVDRKGAPLRTPVALSPGGDVLPTATPDPVTPVYVTPDIDGWIEIAPFAATHVKLAFPGTELRAASGELVPDTCQEGVLTLASAPELTAKEKRRRSK